MNIGILQTAYKKSSDYGAFYNVQEIGLGRALASCGHVVTLYKGVDGAPSERTECNNLLTIKLISLKYIGINGLIDTNILDDSLDVLIYFCDTQLKVPSVYRWCIRHNIRFYPYVGVIESHSPNRLKRILMDIISHRNINIYQKCNILTKTPNISSTLTNLGCNNVTMLPVGLDETVMHSVDLPAIPLSHSIDSLLFIGRMEPEKQPLEMLHIYEELLSVNHQLKLTMIGDGYMYNEVENKSLSIAQKHALTNDQISIIKKIKYEDMCNFYLSHSCYVNLNKVEILGMSILEAMYYGCPVFALKAPGPDFLLSDNTDTSYGYIAQDTDELTDLLRKYVVPNAPVEDINTRIINANKRVHKHFTWTSIVNNLEL